MEVKQKVLILDRTTKTGVAATAVVSAGGSITSVVISDGGSGYTVAPKVSIGVTAGIGTITAGVGTTSGNATADATVSAAGTITSVVISDGGDGYTAAPAVTIQQPISVGGTGFAGIGSTTIAKVSSTISNGTVTAITVGVQSGIGYTDAAPPQVLIAPPTYV